MKKTVSYILSLILFIASLYLMNDIQGIGKIFLIGGLIVGVLIVRWVMYKLIETISNL